MQRKRIGDGVTRPIDVDAIVTLVAALENDVVADNNDLKSWNGSNESYFCIFTANLKLPFYTNVAVELSFHQEKYKFIAQP